MRKDFSSTEFLRLKAMAIKNEPSILKTTLSDITIEPDSFDQSYIIIKMRDRKDYRVTVTKSFFKQFAKLLKINISMRKVFTEEDTKNNTRYSEFLNALKNVQNSNLPIDVTLMFDVIDKKITSITAGNFNKLTNKTIFNFAESLVNKYDNLSVFDVSTNVHSPNVSIKLLSGNIMDLSDPSFTLEDESFQFGMTLGNTGLQTSVGDFAYRLVCSNGMMGIKTDERFLLDSTDTDGLKKMFDYFDVMREQKFIPTEFVDKFEKANQIYASYYELRETYAFLKKKLIYEFPDLSEQMDYAFGDTYFPEVRVIQARMQLKNINESDLPKKALQSIKTKTTMWQLLNIITDLGSNPHQVYKLANKNGIQLYAGNLMSNAWDNEYDGLLI